MFKRKIEFLGFAIEVFSFVFSGFAYGIGEFIFGTGFLILGMITAAVVGDKIYKRGKNGNS